MSEVTLYDNEGQRLYLTGEERTAFIDAAQRSKRQYRTFCHVLAYTGCRISEALQLTPERVDFSDQTLIFRTLKKRKDNVYRAVPVPPTLLDSLDMVHGLQEIQSRKDKAALTTPLWDWTRQNGHKVIVRVMNEAGIQDGAHKMPKGLRHAYGIHAISCKVELNMLKKWMGHSSMAVTEIYANAMGEEQRSIAARMW